MKTAIVGAGEISKLHVSFLKKAHHEIVGIVDSNQQKWHEIKESWGIAKCYSSLEKLFEEEPVDVVHICTPIQTHAQIASKALEKGCHVIVEKPLSISYEESERLYKLANEKSLKIFQVENFLFHPSIVKARQFMNENRFGKIEYVHITWSMPTYLSEKIPLWMECLPGKKFAEVAMHPIYLALAFIGHEIQGIQTNLLRTAQNEPDTLTIFVKSKTSVGVISILTRNASPAMLTITGDRAAVSINIDNTSFTKYEEYSDNLRSKFMFNFTTSLQLLNSSISTTAKYIRGTFKEGYHYAFLQSAYDSISKEFQSPTEPKHVLASIKVYETALDELKDNQITTTEAVASNCFAEQAKIMPKK